MAHEKGDRPPSLKGRRPVITSVEMFLWRNYLIFLSCTAPPSSPQASLMGSADRWVGSVRNETQWAGSARNETQWAGSARNETQWVGSARNETQWAGSVRNETVGGVSQE